MSLSIQRPNDDNDIRNQGVAIIGLGCRLPGANNPAAFWKLLCDEVDAVSEVPAERYDVDLFYDPRPGIPGKIASRDGGFVEGVDQFDPYFFGISPRDAISMDPQHRLMLESAWQAIEDAGVTQEQLTGGRTGVFLGISTDDYQQLQLTSRDSDLSSKLGSSRATAAGRLSYVLRLNGPSLSLDTACSSSLVAIHLAAQAVRRGECELALAGGANVLLHPRATIAFTQGGLLSPEGRCKAFDESARGFVRSEGAGMVLLKRLDQALADGDPIYAVVRGSAVNNDGPSNLFMTPGREGQEEVLRRCYAEAGIEPREVQYLEAHGTGTAVGDPIEAEALANVFGENRAQDQPLLVGSGKTNIGHTEAAAGVAGVIKAALCLKHSYIPANLHFENLNAKIDWKSLPISIASESTAWPNAARTRLAGVSSFGVTGTNAHMLLESAPETTLTPETAEPHSYLVPISARDTVSLTTAAESWRDFLTQTTADFTDIAYNAALRRSHFDHRLCITASNQDEMVEALEAWLRGESHPRVVSGRVEEVVWSKPVFVFSGVGSQWAGMAVDLYEQGGVFRTVLDQADEALHKLTGWSVITEIRRSDADSRLGRVDVLQPAVFSVAIALAALWRSWGIEPAAVVGHSVGEIAAAYIAGALSLDDAALLVVARSRLMQRTSGKGAMLACDLNAEQAAELLQGQENLVSIAVINHAKSLVLSGDPDALEVIASQLQERDAFCRWVKSPIAAHSPQMQPLMEELQTNIAAVRPQPETTPFFSTVAGTRYSGRDLTAEYWVKNLRQPVLFGSAMQTLLDEGANVFIEVSPHSLLLIPIQQAAAQRKTNVLTVGSMRRNENASTAMLDSFARLYTAGFNVDWKRLYPGKRKHVALPGHPMRKERFWFADRRAGHKQFSSSFRTPSMFGHPMISAHWEASGSPGVRVWEALLDVALLPFLADHVVQGHSIFPAAGYLDLAIFAARHVCVDGPLHFRDVNFHRSLFLSETESVLLQMVLSPAGGERWKISFYGRPAEADAGSGWELYSDMMLRANAAEFRPIDPGLDLKALDVRFPDSITGDEFYEHMPEYELSYTGAFRIVERIWAGDEEAVGLIKIGEHYRAEARHYKIHPAILDGVLQLPLTRLLSTGEKKTIVPFAIQDLWVGDIPALEDPWLCHTRGQDHEDGITGNDITVFSPNGEIAIQFLFQQAKTIAVQANSDDEQDLNNWYYKIAWDAAESPEFERTPGRWIILDNRDPLSDQVARLLRLHGQEVVRLGEPVVDDDELRGFIRTHLNDAGLPLRGIVHLASLSATPNEAVTSSVLLEDQRHTCGSLVAAIQTCASEERHVPLFVVTLGAQGVLPGDSVALSQTPLLALGRVISHEYLDYPATLIDADASDPGVAASIAHALLTGSNGENEIALRGGRRLVRRLERLKLDAVPRRTKRIHIQDDGEDSYSVASSGRGVLDNIVLEADERIAPGPGQVEIRVYAGGLNFLDVLRGLDILYPGQTAKKDPFGMECSGKIVRVGAGVSALRPGDEVIAMAGITAGSFRAFLTVEAESVFAKPPSMSFAEAATIPVAYQTAWYALHELGRIRKNDSVLIHAAAGGVGLAAVAIAKNAGAKIFATAGSEAKRAYLRSIGVDVVMDSRTLKFADEVLEATGGRGVDLVLNSIAGEAIPKSLSILATGGRFLEIGKRDIYGNSSIGLLPFQKNLAFFAVDLLRLTLERPEVVRRVTQEVIDRAASGELPPLPFKAFPASEAADAFRYMAQAKHTGKVVLLFEQEEVEVVVPDEMIVRADATYLITGGLTGLGLACAEWLAESGARNLVLAGRRAPNAVAEAAMERLREGGVTVMPVSADISVEADVERILADVRQSLPPLRGVIHSAAVLIDGIVANFEWSEFEEVLAPKLQGSWNLHQLVQDEPLDFFVQFSSAASLFGSAGQAKYAAANSFLDGLGEYRHRAGYPVLTINWGPWSEIGLSVRPDRGERLQGIGMNSIPPKAGLTALGSLLGRNCPAAMVFPIDWQRWANAQPHVRNEPFLEHMRAEMQLANGAEGSDSTALVDEVLAADEDTGKQILEQHLRKQTTRVLRIPDERLDGHTSLTKLGIDSLMAVELKNRIDADLGISLPVLRLLKGPSLHELAGVIHAELAKTRIERMNAGKQAPVSQFVASAG